MTDDPAPSRSRLAHAVLFLVPATLLALGLYMRTLAEGALAAFMDYETPFAFERAPVPPARPMVQNVVVVLVDGLGLLPSREMRVLGELRAQGADYAARIGLPSLSQPGRAVLMTGAWQEVHGQPTNFKPRPLRVEHLFQTVRRAGGTTALSGMGEGVHKLFQPHVQKTLAFADPPESAPLEVYEAKLQEMTSGAQRIAAEKPTFALLEMLIVDEAGHNLAARRRSTARPRSSSTRSCASSSPRWT